MARLFRPERVEYDVLTSGAPGSEQAAGEWTTAAVDAVSPGPLNGIEALHDYASSLVPRLRDFAEHMGSPRDVPSPALRFTSYQAVRAMVRGAGEEALAEVRADGRVQVPAELDPELRGRLHGLVNVGLPMVSRSIEQGAYENALESLVKARGVLNATLQAVLTMAANGPEPVPREKLAAAMRISPADLESWYAGRRGR